MSEWTEHVEQGASGGRTYVVVRHVRSREGRPGEECSMRADLPGELNADGVPKQTVEQIIAALHAKVREAREK